jgi:hypothetical protein
LRFFDEAVLIRSFRDPCFKTIAAVLNQLAKDGTLGHRLPNLSVVSNSNEKRGLLQSLADIPFLPLVHVEPCEVNNGGSSFRENNGVSSRENNGVSSFIDW